MAAHGKCSSEPMLPPPPLPLPPLAGPIATAHAPVPVGVTVAAEAGAACSSAVAATAAPAAASAFAAAVASAGDGGCSSRAVSRTAANQGWPRAAVQLFTRAQTMKRPKQLHIDYETPQDADTKATRIKF